MLFFRSITFETFKKSKKLMFQKPKRRGEKKNEKEKASHMRYSKLECFEVFFFTTFLHLLKFVDVKMRKQKIDKVKKE